MSAQIPESIPTSSDSRSHRPLKRARGPATAIAAQSSAVEHLFAQPDKEIVIPSSATRARTAGDMAPPPEIVANVQGSSAGAGSGEFHVYKASRRREFERIRLMEEEANKEDADKAWAAKQEERKKKDEEGRSKNAKRREKAKARKNGQKAGSENGAAEKVTGKPGRNVGIPRANETNDGKDAVEDVPVKVEQENGLIIHDDD